MIKFILHLKVLKIIDLNIWAIYYFLAIFRVSDISK